MGVSNADRLDLVVVGAGIAGLNALYVASRYLGRDGRIALVDRHSAAGGMWTETYDHVRLHQPHPVFTVGDLPWRDGKPARHLADKAEVVAHLRRCLAEVSTRVDVRTYFGHELVSADEDAEGVEVTCRRADGTPVTLRAERLIDARATSIEALKPFELSSDRVRSLAPVTVMPSPRDVTADDAPIWVVGSGKTGMDTCLALITALPGREVDLIAGTGTFFIDRDRILPPGQLLTRGVRPNRVLISLVDRFDGTNEAEVLAWARDTYGTSPVDDAEHFFIGILAASETATIRAGLTHVVRDHFEDAVDDPSGDGALLRLRSGAQIPVPAGSCVVNCTSHFAPGDRAADPPYLSPLGRIVTVGQAPPFGFTSFSAYFMTHLLYTGDLATVPLYTIDTIGLLRRSTPAAVLSLLVASQYNLGLAFDALPLSVFRQWGLDFDRLYPMPRQLAGQVSFMRGHKRKRDGYRRALDVVGERFDVAHGPLEQVGGVPSSR